MTNADQLYDLMIRAPRDAYGCTSTKDMAQWLHDNGVIVPPCKVGDTVYKISFTPCSTYGERSDSSACNGCEVPCDSSETIATFVVPSLTWIVREFIDNVKQYYFLTRKEAEQALKERVANA